MSEKAGTLKALSKATGLSRGYSKTQETAQWALESLVDGLTGALGFPINGSKASTLGELAMAAMPLIGGVKALRGAKMAATEATAARQPIRAFHGSPHDFDKIRGDKAGVAYVAFVRDIAGSYGPVRKVQVRTKNPLELGSNPYDYDGLIDAVDDDAAAIVRKYAHPDENGTTHGLHTALRDPQVIASLRSRGYDAVKFADDHGPNVKPMVMAVLDPSLISIVKKYGIAGAVSAGLLSQAQAQQMAEQGYK